MPIMREEFDEMKVFRGGQFLENLLSEGKITVDELAVKTGMGKAALWSKLNHIKNIRHKRPYWWINGK